ncbi:ABC transporter substrate-binding protein [Streptomyces sp. NPDC060194]|uniref:ABC transporter substrate-binding protein n=1 Tax=Streptomyces sp. NPDC060194 TaxID=3347069 RepID=UPI003653941C
MAFSRRNFLIATGVAAGSATVLSACGSGNAGGGAGSTGKTKTVSDGKAAAFTVGTKADSVGPAPEVKGAVRGGTIFTLDRDDFSHLDPQQIYYAYTQAGTILIHRGLTGYKSDAKDNVVLVGDLATDAGTMKDGGKTWSFTLKDGLKWQDGSELTAEDVKWTIERSFAPFITQGPRYVQDFLEGAEGYKGPYDGKRLDSVEVSGKTITFRLKEARPDFNFTLAMAGYGIVSKKNDTKQKYDKKPFACGPYMIESRVTDKSMTLVRNPHWDAKTDPIRNDYPDKYTFRFGFQALASTDRYIADSGDDQYSMSILNVVATERVQKVLGTPALKERVIEHLGAGAYYWAVNTKRVTDVEVRRALIEAWPNQQSQTVRGGKTQSEIATTLMSPLSAGREDFDLYGKRKKPSGDPAAAKARLKKAGKLGQKIVFAFPQTETNVKNAVVVRKALAAAGFEPVAKAIDSTTFYDEIGKLDNEFDVMAAGWVPDWSTGYTVFQPTFESHAVVEGGVNWSQLKDKTVDKAIANADSITDPAEAGKAWAAVDRMLVDKAVAIPDYFPIRNYMHGSKVGNPVYDVGYDCAALHKAYAKK